MLRKVWRPAPVDRAGLHSTPVRQAHESFVHINKRKGSPISVGNTCPRMKKRYLITWMLCFAAVVWAVAEQTNINSANPHTETKVSESRKNGKYKRITETFTDKVLASRKEEVSLKDNDQIDFVFVKLFRNGEMTCASTFYKAENRTVRSYYHHGKMLIEEGDEDGDGFFETMILFDATEQPVEAFKKSKEGIVTQLSKEKFLELKKSFALIGGKADPK